MISDDGPEFRLLVVEHEVLNHRRRGQELTQ
jgi:hypothetical protein